MNDRRSGYHHGDLRRALMSAALELLEEQGHGDLSLRAVARKAGVSSGAPYHHFADKPALLAALAGDGFAALVDVMDRARQTAVGLPLRPIAEAYMAFARERPELYQLMTLSLDEPAPETGDVVSRQVGVVIAAALERYPDVPQAQRPSVAVALWGSLHGLAILTRSRALTSTLRDLGGRERVINTAFDHLAKVVIAREREKG